MGGLEERGKWVMGIEKGTCWYEHWVLNVSDESLESTPKTKSTLYILYDSQFDNKLHFSKKKCLFLSSAHFYLLFFNVYFIFETERDRA